MVQQLKYGVKSPLILAGIVALFLGGCSSRMEPEVKVVTKLEKITVPLATLPKPVQLNDVKIYVVNKDILEEFTKEFIEENGELAFVALSIKDYENLALNVAELRRYINQQKQIIIYYEKAVTPEVEK